MGLGLLSLWGLRRHPRLSRAGLGLTVACLYLLSTPVVQLTLRRSLEFDPPFNPVDLNGRAQAIVVLGGGMQPSAPEYGHPIPTGPTLMRVEYGAHLQKLTGLPVLVSGGDHEAEAMAFALREAGLPEDKIWQEGESRTTWENSLCCSRILEQRQCHTVVLVTQSFHMLRSRRSFEAAGLQVIPAPCDFARGGQLDQGFMAVVPQASCLARSATVLEEWGCLLFYRLRYW